MKKRNKYQWIKSEILKLLLFAIALSAPTLLLAQTSFSLTAQPDYSSLVLAGKEKAKSTTVATPAYTGNAISLNFQDIPIRNALQIIADASQLNLVMSDAITGNITLRLEQVPWDQALATILKIKKLTQSRVGNVLMIAPHGSLFNSPESDSLTHQSTGPIESEFIQINYAKAADIATMLTADDAHLLSSKGHVSSDARTNTVLVRDTREVIEAIKDIIKALDVPVRQVVIEARMVTVNESIGKKLGVQWGGTAASGQVASAGTLSGIGETGSDSLNDRLSVNLPVLGAAGNLAVQVGQLASDHILDLQLSALEQENKAEIIATPRITALNQQTAYIEQGTEIPYVEASSSGATSVSFKKAVLSLQVTPQITPDNNVMLDLVITQDSKGDTVATSTGDAIAINTQEIATQVLIENGDTLVLGGIYQQRVTNTVNKVPVLGDIPYLGYFFRSTQHETSKAELLIFVTPHIVIQQKHFHS